MAAYGREDVPAPDNWLRPQRAAYLATLAMLADRTNTRGGDRARVAAEEYANILRDRENMPRGYFHERYMSARITLGTNPLNNIKDIAMYSDIFSLRDAVIYACSFIKNYKEQSSASAAASLQAPPQYVNYADILPIQLREYYTSTQERYKKNITDNVMLVNTMFFLHTAFAPDSYNLPVNFTVDNIKIWLDNIVKNIKEIDDKLLKIQHAAQLASKFWEQKKTADADHDWGVRENIVYEEALRAGVVAQLEFILRFYTQSLRTIDARFAVNLSLPLLIERFGYAAVMIMQPYQKLLTRSSRPGIRHLLIHDALRVFARAIGRTLPVRDSEDVDFRLSVLSPPDTWDEQRQVQYFSTLAAVIDHVHDMGAEDVADEMAGYFNEMQRLYEEAPSQLILIASTTYFDQMFKYLPITQQEIIKSYSDEDVASFLSGYSNIRDHISDILLASAQTNTIKFNIPSNTPEAARRVYDRMVKWYPEKEVDVYLTAMLLPGLQNIFAPKGDTLNSKDIIFETSVYNGEKILKVIENIEEIATRAVDAVTARKYMDNAHVISLLKTRILELARRSGVEACVGALIIEYQRDRPNDAFFTKSAKQHLDACFVEQLGLTIAQLIEAYVALRAPATWPALRRQLMANMMRGLAEGAQRRLQTALV